MERDQNLLKNALLMIIYHAISLVDDGEHESIGTIEENMFKETLVQYLIRNYGDKCDFSVFETGTYSMKDVNRAFFDIAGYVNGNESRKYGVTKNGLNLLIAVAFNLHADLK